MNHVCIVPLHDYFSKTHLEEVIEKMKVFGPPALKASFIENRWYLLEGTHRSRAAIITGLPIFINKVEWTYGRKAISRAVHRKCLVCQQKSKQMVCVP